MRVRTEDMVTAKKSGNQTDAENCYVQLSRDLAFFEVKLQALDNILAALKTLEEARHWLEERKTLQSFVDALKNYFSEIETKTTLGFKRNKLNDQDMLVLKAQADGIHGMREKLRSDTMSLDNLSQLINDAAQMEYQVSYAKVWLRRGIALVGGLVSAALTVGVVALMMSPAVHIGAAIAAVPTMLAAALAFFYARSPVTTSTSVNLNGYPVNVSTPVPSTLGVAGAGIVSVSLFHKLRVTNPKKEEAARMLAVGTINQLTDQLKIKIEALSDTTVKDFLLSVINEADKMYNAGAQSWFYEMRVSKMQKARLILRETAKLLEEKAANSVNEILSRQINVTGHEFKLCYTFQQLLNAQRNTYSFFSNRTSHFAKVILKDAKDIGKNAVSLKAIAATI